ncbi:prolipoprotein diacylglyceryl transferase [Candidatus Pantoea edessiphila]|uniref:Phosphatidylglycerol--prolipoprotein diacylglyceryl transferase n=1 Tax=Candidatus Pantoea edessiphila TaxID=2044610 RepID=A0A2P5SXL2_9GAMM|nr:prolipoprotein diacylglyceryl transferase [Candidatus Pantoea edessiphila]MBK4775693.1 prolipoprotein diacylglyceryl transferase [Pantoea sp. Edef]PPI87076.1 prolipoprotein diacylglyceryl transferase [Candidatus Pantoea edessiphila]
MNIKYITLPKINPIIFSIGPISFRWYGLMYLVGLIFALWLAKLRAKKYNYSIKEIEGLIYHCFFGAIIGGRIGYMFFYNLPLLIDKPLSLIKIWEGGMSFHGGLLGVILIIVYHCYKNQRIFFEISDFIAPLIPFGLGVGRLGNFINGELWGRVDLYFPFTVFFPNAYNEDLKTALENPTYQSLFEYYGALPRHPSQLYEFILEGVILFFILNIFVLKNRPLGSTSGLFLVCYGIFRILVEFFREPDIQLGLFYDSITMGQILSLPMFIIGIIILVWSNFNLKNRR